MACRASLAPSCAGHASLGHSQTLVYDLLVAALTLQWLRGVAATEIVQPAKLKAVTIWPFAEQPC